MIWRVLSTGWNLLHPNKSTTQIWVRICLQYGISTLKPQTSFRGETVSAWRCEKSAVFSQPQRASEIVWTLEERFRISTRAMSVMFYLLYKHQWNTIAVKGAIWCSHCDGNLFTCYRRKIRNLMFYFYLIWICRKVSSHLLTSCQTVLRRSKLEPP